MTGEIATAAIVSSDLEGDTILTWAYSTDGYNYRLHARSWRRDGTLGPVLVLDAISMSSVNGREFPFAHSALDDDGNGVVTWTRREPEPDTGALGVWTRRVRRDGTLGPAVRIQRGGGAVVAMTPDGGARMILLDETMLYLTGP